MTIKNTQPALFQIRSIEVGYTKVLVTHNLPTDRDINSRVSWTKAAGALKSSAVQVSHLYTDVNNITVSGLTAATSYDFTYALVDDFIAGDAALLTAQYTGTADILSLLDDFAVSTQDIIKITSATSFSNDQSQIGAPPSTVAFTLSGAATAFEIQAEDQSNIGVWFTIYTGSTSEDVQVSMKQGTYKFRTKSQYRFSDGTIDSGTDNYPTELAVIGSIAAPVAPTGLGVTALKYLGSINTYALDVSWAWAVAAGGQKQNTLVSYIEYDGIADKATLDWTNAKNEVSMGTDHRFLGVPYRKHLAVQVLVNGWNQNSSAATYYDVYISEDTNESAVTGYIVPVDASTIPAGTNIHIDERYIKAFSDWNGTNGTNTFNLDAEFGSVSIGPVGTYNGVAGVTPFSFNGETGIFGIAGQVIAGEIIAADHVLGWLGGTAPTLRTANRDKGITGWDQATAGMWFGYEDVDTFKFSLGNGTNYMKWDGSTLKISGTVQIGDSGDTLGDLGSKTLVEIYSEDANFYTVGEVAMPLTATPIVFPTITRGVSESLTLSVKLKDAEAGEVVLKFNSVTVSPEPVAADQVAGWFHYAVVGDVSGVNEVSIEAPTGDGVEFQNLVITLGIPTGDNPTGWTSVRPSTTAGSVSTVSATAYKDGDGILIGTWSTPIRINEGSDGSAGKYQETWYIPADTQPATPPALNPSPTNGADIYSASLPPALPEETVWATTATKDGAGDVIIGWSQPEIIKPAVVSAKTLILTSTSQVFLYNGDGSPGPAGQSIDFVAQDSNLDDPLVFQSSPPVNLTGTGDTRSLSIADFGVNNSVAVTVNSGAFSDVITVYRLTDGGDAYSAFLTNENHTVTTDSNGDFGNYDSSNGDFLVFKGSTQVTPDEYTVVATTGEPLVVFIDAQTGVYQVEEPQIGYTATVTFGAVLEGGALVLEKTYTLSKAPQGVKGNPGTDSVVPGPGGDRGPGQFTRGVADLTIWEDAEALIATGGDPKIDDAVTLYSTTSADGMPVLVGRYVGTGGTGLTGTTAYDKFELIINGDVLVEGSVVAEKIAVGAIDASKILSGNVNTAHLKVASGGDLDADGNIANTGLVTIDIDPSSATPIMIANVTRDGSNVVTSTTPIFSVGQVLVDPSDAAQGFNQGALVMGRAGVNFCATADSIAGSVKKAINPYYGVGVDVTATGLPYNFSSTDTKTMAVTVAASDTDVELEFSYALSVNKSSESLTFATTYVDPDWIVSIHMGAANGDQIEPSRTYYGTSNNTTIWSGGEPMEHYGGCSLYINDSMKHIHSKGTSVTYYIKLTRASVWGGDTPTTITASQIDVTAPSFIENTLIKGANGYWKDKESGLIIQWGRTPNQASNTSVNFPLTFTTGCTPAVTANAVDLSNLAYCSVNTIGLSSFKVAFSGGNSSEICSWMAIGY